jgi:hypothetical protein
MYSEGVFPQNLLPLSGPCHETGEKALGLFPVTLDELIPEDHVCRVIDAFVGRLDANKDVQRKFPPLTILNV